MHIVGISAYYHDSAAVIIENSNIIAAAQEERFSRKKHDSRFPLNSLKYCLKEANVNLEAVDYITFYDKPFLKFERLLETYIAEAPFGLKSFIASMPVWLKDKLFLKKMLIKEIQKIQTVPKKSLSDKIYFTEHHQSHAASAFYPSHFEEASILTIDGVGEWTTTSIANGKKNNIIILEEIKFPHSIGLLYSAFTYYTGFKVNSGEYKLMGLAPYGEPRYVDKIKDNLIDIKEDGSFRLNMKYFNFTVGLSMINDKFNQLFGGLPRKGESQLSQKEMDIARSIQDVTEEVILKIARYIRKESKCENLCLAGGVALNCVGNGKILRKKIFKDIWIQPAAGDAGGALGAALSMYYQELGNHRKCNSHVRDNMKGSYLGPSFTNIEVKQHLDKYGAVYWKIANEEKLYETIANKINDGKVIGWHQGRMEYGPRALGARSIIGDARNRKMQTTMNLKVKYRESFRPFAPSVLRSSMSDYFELNEDSPYMLLVAPVKKDIRYKMTKEQKALFGIDKLNIIRSTIPSITHVNYSARVQTVHEDTNPKYYKLLKAFQNKTGYSVIINTSFNVRGEPIVCNPEDSYRCFMRTEMDILVIEDYILYKEEQPEFIDEENWETIFELD